VAENLRWARRRRPLAVLFARELLAGDAQIKRLIRCAAAPCVMQLAKILQTGMDRGEVRSVAAPDTLAFTFICLTNMLLLQIWDAHANWPRSADLQAAATLFLQGVGSAPAQR
jgi:hypothetical protein